MKKIGMIGSGVVAKTLGNGFLKHGYQTMLGTRSPEKLENWSDDTAKESLVGSFQDTAKFGDILVLAVKGSVAKDVLESISKDDLAGKVIIDPTNPIADKPPVNGVLNFFTDQNGSLLETLQATVPQGRFVKAFSSVGSPKMINPGFEVTPTMFICGNDDEAKSEVSEIIEKFGWESEDMGSAEAARAIEPLCMLWCIPGFRNNQWTHAFKLLK